MSPNSSRDPPVYRLMEKVAAALERLSDIKAAVRAPLFYLRGNLGGSFSVRLVSLFFPVRQQLLVCAGAYTNSIAAIWRRRQRAELICISVCLQSEELPVEFPVVA